MKVTLGGDRRQAHPKHKSQGTKKNLQPMDLACKETFKLTNSAAVFRKKTKGGRQKLVMRHKRIQKNASDVSLSDGAL